MVYPTMALLGLFHIRKREERTCNFLCSNITYSTLACFLCYVVKTRVYMYFDTSKYQSYFQSCKIFDQRLLKHHYTVLSMIRNEARGNRYILLHTVMYKMYERCKISKEQSNFGVNELIDIKLLWMIWSFLLMAYVCIYFCFKYHAIIKYCTYLSISLYWR